MRYIKVLSLAAIAAAALMASVAGGSASATVICTATPSAGFHCVAREENGQTLDASVETSTLWKTGGGTTIATCTAGTIKLVISNEGNTAQTVSGVYEEHTKSGCTTTVKILANGTWEIHHIPGTDNGTLTSTGTETTISFLGVSCIFKTNNTQVGTLTGGNPATIDASGSIPSSTGGFCPTAALTSGAYKFTTPSGTLHVVAG